MNTNAIHNVLNIAGVLVNVIGYAMTQAGCSALPNGNFDCTSSTIIPSSFLPYIMMIGTLMAMSKIIMNLVRDGMGGLWKVQPPVAEKMVTVNVPAPQGAKVEVKTPSKPVVKKNFR